MRLLTALLPAFAYVGIVGCAAEDPGSPPSQASDDGSGGATGAFTSNNAANNNTTSAATTSPTSNAASGVNAANTANATSSSTSTNGGPLGPTSAGPTSAGPTSGGQTSASSTTGGFTTGGPTTGAQTSAGPTTGGPTTVGGPTTDGAGGAGSVTTATTGSSTTGGVPADPDCNAAMPSGAGTPHSGNGRGGSGNLSWEIWSNTGAGELDSFEGVTAFRASWNNAGGYLGRMGFEWGNSGPPHTDHGRIYAQFVANKTVVSGNGGGDYSYVGMYGWTLNPCVEWYVIEDTFKSLPFNPGGTTDKGQVTIDGGTYQVYTRQTPGTGGSRCGSSVTSWIQYYSIRTSPRSCGVISLTDHFEAWESKGMSMAGNLLEAKILAEVGGDAGSVDFPVANVTTTQ